MDDNRGCPYEIKSTSINYKVPSRGTNVIIYWGINAAFIFQDTNDVFQHRTISNIQCMYVPLLKQLHPIRKKHEEYVDIARRNKDVLRNETSLTSPHTTTPRGETALGGREVTRLTIIAVSACLPDKLASGSNQSTRIAVDSRADRTVNCWTLDELPRARASHDRAEVAHARAHTRRRAVHPVEFKQTRCLRFPQSSSRTGGGAW